MANLICIYAMFASPVIWAIQNLSCLSANRTFREESHFFGLEVLMLLGYSAATLVIATLLFWGGMRLRALRRTGPLLIQAGIGGSVAVGILVVVIGVALMQFADAADMAEDTPAGSVVDFLMMALGIIDFACMIVIFLWLYRYKTRLPLTAN